MYYVRQTFPLQRGGLGSRLRVLYTISLCYFMYPLHKILKNSFVISTGSGTSAVVSCGHTSFNGVWLCSCTSSLPCLIFGPALICSLCSPVCCPIVSTFPFLLIVCRVTSRIQWFHINDPAALLREHNGILHADFFEHWSCTHYVFHWLH